MKTKKSYFARYALCVVLVLFAAIPFFASADWIDGLNLAESGSGLPSSEMVDDVIFNVMQWLLLVFTFIAVIAFVVTGMMFLLSGGNANMAERAKRGVAYSIIGVAVGLIGYIIIAQIDALLEGVI